MTPEERRSSIIHRQMEGGFTDWQIKKESGYQGFPHYKLGTDAGDVNIYAVEQALDRLEAKND